MVAYTEHDVDYANSEFSGRLGKNRIEGRLRRVADLYPIKVHEEYTTLKAEEDAIALAPREEIIDTTILLD